MIKSLLKISSFVLLLVSLFSCGSSDKNKSGDKNKTEDKNKTGENNRDTLSKPANIDRIIGVASIEPLSHIVSLYSETGGIIKRISHDINEEVKENEVIVELVTDVEQAQLEQAQSKLATQESMLASARAQLASVSIKLENARVNYQRNLNLIKSGGITQQVLDDSRFASDSQDADQTSAAANVKQQENKLKELEADINYYQKVVDRKKIKAPVNGKILSMDVRVGNNISTNQSICDFAPDGPLMAITEVDELFADKVSNGMSAYIRPQGKLDTLATGKIFLTSPYLRKKSLFSDDAANMEDRRVREVRVLLDERAKALIGSRVECVILLNTKK
jgi:HlyD family secretion protein